MNLQSKKLQLIDWILSLDNTDDLNKLFELKLGKDKEEWLVALSENEKKSFMKGIEQYEKKQFVDSKTVKSKFEKTS